jgi:hypothetical protein
MLEPDRRQLECPEEWASAVKLHPFAFTRSHLFATLVSTCDLILEHRLEATPTSLHSTAEKISRMRWVMVGSLLDAPDISVHSDSKLKSTALKPGRKFCHIDEIFTCVRPAGRMYVRGS